MKIIVFNTENSVINFDSETQMVKCGYLMADTICIAGQLGAHLLFEEEYKNFGILRKVQFLYDILLPETNHAEDKEVYLKSLLEFMKIAKDYPKIRNPTQDLSFAYNNSRRLYSDWFDGYRENILNLQKKVGFSELSALSKEPNIETKLLNMSLGRYTHSKHEAESNAKLILELLFPTNKSNKPSILMLPLEFTSFLEMLAEEDKKDKPIDELKENNDDEDDDDSFLCLLQVLKIPDFRILSALQVKALKVELSEPFKNINNKLEAWTLFCKKSDNSVEIFDNFNENVLEYFTDMQNIIDHNQTLNDLKNNPSFNFFENNFCVGICPIDLLLMFYEVYWVVDPLTLSYLRKRTKNNNSYPEYFPILHIYPELNGGVKDEDKSEEIIEDIMENKPKKKYLRID